MKNNITQKNNYVVARRALFPTKQPPIREGIALLCNTPALTGGARERSAAQARNDMFTVEVTL